MIATHLSPRMAFAAGLFMFGVGANAATLDFTLTTSGFALEAYTDATVSSSWGHTLGGDISSEGGVSTAILDVTGENLDIHLSNGTGIGNPYFDADSGGLPGGLGSCSAGLSNTAQCTTSSDDNLTIKSGEAVRMDFKTDSGVNTLVSLGDFFFGNDGHGAFTGSVEVAYNGVASALIAVTAGTADFSGIGPISFLEFGDGGSGTGTSSTGNYYIAGATMSAVPIPAAAWLFGSGLVGLTAITRRKKAV